MPLVFGWTWRVCCCVAVVLLLCCCCVAVVVLLLQASDTLLMNAGLEGALFPSWHTAAIKTTQRGKGIMAARTVVAVRHLRHHPDSSLWNIGRWCGGGR